MGRVEVPVRRQADLQLSERCALHFAILECQSVRRVLYPLCLTPILAGCASMAGPNCDLRRPPKDSGVNQLEGRFVFIYPRALASDYSGCQTMWGDDGRKWYVLRVRDGRPAELTIDIAETGEKRQQGVYDETQLMKGDADICPGLGALKRAGGLPVIPQEREPAVPAEADLRGK